MQLGTKMHRGAKNILEQKVRTGTKAILEEKSSRNKNHPGTKVDLEQNAT